MDDLSELTLDEMLEKAHEVSALDGWEKVDDTIVFQLATMSIAIRESFAKTFARGLLRGYERAATLGEGNKQNANNP